MSDTLTPDDLRGIADELRCNAEALRDGHTLRGEWHDDDARREHDKLIRWADALNHTANDLEMVGLQCLADIRAALGDTGQMMQPELVECVKRLRKDAERLDSGRIRLVVRDDFGDPAPTVFMQVDLRAAIDAAMAKEASE